MARSAPIICTVDAATKLAIVNYFDRLAVGNRHTTFGRLVGPIVRRERLLVCDLAVMVRGLTLLDVGCGVGYYALRAKAHGMRVTATDISPAMVHQIAGSIDDAFVSDVETLRLDCRFDRVVCAGVLAFVTDPEQALERLAGHVAPGGVLVILVPSLGLGGLLYRSERRRHGIDINLFSPSWFEQAAPKVDLQISHVGRPFLHSLVIRLERPRPERLDRWFR